MCYNTKFGRSIRQTLRRGIVVTKIGDGSAHGMGRGWPRRIRPPPHTCNLAKCGRSKSNGIHNTEIRLLAFYIAKSLKVTETDSRSIGWLPIASC